MRKTISVIVIVCSVLAMVSCTKKVETCTVTERDGVKIFKNKNIPTIEKLDFNPVKKFTINNDPEDENYLTYFDLDGLGTDSEKSIFVANLGGDPRVNKYDNGGKFIKTFVTKGTGPGEMREIGFLCVKNDTVYVGERFTPRVSLFDIDGKFLSYKESEGEVYQVNPAGRNKFYSIIFNAFNNKEGQVLYSLKWVLLNNDFKISNILYESVVNPSKAALTDQWSYIASSEDRIFLGVNDKDFYTINVYDHNGKFIEVIHKDYIVTKYTDEEIDKLERYLTRTNQMGLDRSLMNKKRAVVGVYIDKNQNLLIHPAEDITKTKSNGLKLDFFDKSNKYLNSTVLKTEVPYYQCEFSIFPKFFDNRLFLVDGVRNVIDVYEY
jgi:hypothetical protein